jgi:RHH-type transcriptional regulator, rel operon repressor / antitoxin RelB
MLGVRLDKDTERDLEALAKQTRRPKSQIAREAIRAYVARHGRVARAKAEWAEISRRERRSPEMDSILDFGAQEMDRQL